jgi:hypothetical protein
MANGFEKMYLLICEANSARRAVVDPLLLLITKIIFHIKYFVILAIKSDQIKE